MDQFDTPFCFFLFDPCCECFFFGEGREDGVSSLLRVVGWLVVEGKSKREREKCQTNKNRSSRTCEERG